jgi:hypothetical protein
MADAVEHARARLVRATSVLRGASIPHAVVGGNAVAAWVATIDATAVRNTQEVDILIRRADFGQARSALEAAGFVYRHAAGIDMFLESPTASPRSGIHLVFANEMVRPDDFAPNPQVDESTDLGGFTVLNLDALIRAKLTSFRLKDRVHLLDLIAIGLIDSAWTTRLSPPLAERLQSLLDNPDA